MNAKKLKLLVSLAKHRGIKTMGEFALFLKNNPFLLTGGR